MYTSDEIAKFPAAETIRFGGPSMATGGGWTTDGHWAVKGTCESAGAAAAGLVGRMTSGELVPDGLQPITLAARAEHSTVITQEPAEVPCLDCDGDGVVECCECGSETHCRTCNGRGHIQGPMVDVSRGKAGARWYSHPDGHEIILSDLIASALLDGRDLELFGARADDAVVAKFAGEVVAIIMPMRATDEVKP